MHTRHTHSDSSRYSPEAFPDEFLESDSIASRGCVNSETRDRTRNRARNLGRTEEELRRGAKGVSALYPMHFYDLLPPKGRAKSRAFLYVTYRNDAVFRAGINHYGVIKGRRAGGPRTAAHERALRVEQQRVLLDLEAIREKYRVQLGEAAWAR